MIEGLISYANVFVAQHGVLAVFLLGVAEEVFLPVPSSFTLMAAGFLLLPVYESFSQVLLHAFVSVALPGALGLALGSFFFYFLGYVGGKPLVLRLGRFFGLSWEVIEKVETKFIKGHADELVLFGLRAIPLVPNIAISAFCGLVRYPLKPFIIIAFVGNVVRGFVMALFGFWVGEAYAEYAMKISQVEHILFGVVALCVVILFGYLFYRRSKRKKVL